MGKTMNSVLPNLKSFSRVYIFILFLSTAVFIFSAVKIFNQARNSSIDRSQDISEMIRNVFPSTDVNSTLPVSDSAIGSLMEKMSQLNHSPLLQFCALAQADSVIFSASAPACIKNELQYALHSNDSIRQFHCGDDLSRVKYYWIKTPLSNQISIISVVDSEKATNPYVLLISVAFLVILLLSLATPILYMRLFQKRLQKINRAVEQISDKDFDVYLADDLPGSLGDLMRSINKMRLHLKEVYQDLELRVIRRTSEISMRNAELRKTQKEILKQNHELRSAYEALKESRDKYEQLIEHLEDEYFFFSKAITGTLLFVSASVKKILGYELKEYRDIYEKIYTDNPLNKKARQHEENLKKGLPQPKYLAEVYDHKKQPKLLEISEVAVFTEEGKLVSIEGLAHDVTEQKKAEELIKEQEEKYRMLFTHASDFIVMYELNQTKGIVGKFIEANQYSLDKLGYSLEELRNMSPLDLQAVEVWHENETEQEELAHSENTFERIWESKSGSLLNVEISAHSFKIRNQEVAIAVARDITERKRAEEEIRYVNEELINQKENLEALVDNLTQTREQLVQSEKMAALGQLIAGIAHEINTPLGAIKASIGNLSDSLETALGELPSLFQTQSIDNLQLFKEIFELSRKKTPKLSSREKRQNRREISAKLKEAEIKDADLFADILVYLEIYSDSAEKLIPSLKMKDSLMVVRSARNFISLLKNTNTINLAVEKATKVVFALKKYAHRDALGEKADTDIVDNIETVLTLYNNQLKQGIEVVREYEKLPLVKCYQDEVSQVWTNLIQNSIQAMRQEGTLTIKTHQHGEFVFISFRDTGPGIEPDIIDRIFDPFYTTKKQGEGSGLGLDIVKKIVEKHNGTISVDSILGEGATFIIKLPVE